MSKNYFNTFKYSIPTSIVYGINKLEDVGKLVKQIGNKTLLVTGKRSMKALGFTDKVISLLKKEGLKVALYDRAEPDAPCSIVDEAMEMAIKNDTDVIVGMGGGSTMDTAKAISVIATHGGNTWDYMGIDTVPGPIIPIVAIPTSSGSGSEVIPAAAISNRATKEKSGIVSPYLFPVLAIVDPLLMVSLPLDVTANSGLDTLSHAIEGYCSRISNPIVEPIALKSISLVKAYLARAVKHGKDLEAREGMALACILSGIAVGHMWVGAAHGFGMSIGGLLGTSHGLAVGVILPYVMEYNLPAVPEKLRDIAEAMGVLMTDDPYKDAKNAIESVRGILKEIDFPMRLGDIGVKEDMVKQIVKNRDKDDLANNPRSFTEKAAFKFISEII